MSLSSIFFHFILFFSDLDLTHPYRKESVAHISLSVHRPIHYKEEREKKNRKMIKNLFMLFMPFLSIYLALLEGKQTRHS